MPAMTTPTEIESRARLNFIPSRKAAIDPVHAPVKGKGIATKSASPILSYLSIALPCLRVRSNTQFTIFFPGRTLLAHLATDSRNSSRKGTGTKLPATARVSALCHGIPIKFIATGNAPLSSTTGNIESTNTTASLANCESNSCSTTHAILFSRVKRNYTIRASSRVAIETT